MSVVTSILLTMSVVEDGFHPEEGNAPHLARIIDFLVERGFLPLAYLSPHMCTGKHPQTLTFGGGYNYFPEEEFEQFIAMFEWGSPENVVLVMQPEEGETKVWRPI